MNNDDASSTETDTQVPEEVMSTDESMTIRQRLARIRADLEAIEAELPQEEEEAEAEAESDSEASSEEEQPTYGGRGGSTMARRPAMGRGGRGRR